MDLVVIMGIVLVFREIITVFTVMDFIGKVLPDRKILLK